MLYKLALATAVLALSLLPVQVRASSISFEHDGGGVAYFTSSGFFFENVKGLFTDFPPGVDELTMETGVTLSTTVHADGAVDYEYDGATLTFYSNHIPVAIIPLLPFGFSLSAPIYDPVWGNYPGPVSTLNEGQRQELSLGPGTIDDAIAQALGVHKETLGGTLFLVVDDIAGNVDSAVRQATPNFIAGDIEVKPIPEPSALILMSLCSAAVARRARGRNART